MCFCACTVAIVDEDHETSIRPEEFVVLLFGYVLMAIYSGGGVTGGDLVPAIIANEGLPESLTNLRCR
jgi:hypothetical protein